MSRAIDEMKKISSEERAISTARNLLKNSTLTYEQIANATELPAGKVYQIAEQFEIYLTCEACRYIFVGNRDLVQCPDCGKQQVRCATEGEIADYIRIQEEMELEE